MSQLEVRKARTEDKETVLAFCENTWEWGDYIARTWDEWLADPQGQLFTATAAGEPVGIVHVAMLTKDEAWLEGLRVNPEYRRQGIARALQEAAIVEAMQRGASHARLVVHWQNSASIALSESIHMRRVGAFSNYTAPIFNNPRRQPTADRIQLATPEEVDEIIQYLNTSSILPLTGGVYYTGFKAAAITGELLEQRIQDGMIYLLRRWDRLDGLAIAQLRDESDERRLSVGYIDGTSMDAISLIAYDLRLRLAESGLDRVRVYAPDLAMIRDAFDGAEYESNGEIFYTYERGLY